MEYITDIKQDVINKIESVGYSVTDTDSFILEESIEKVRFYIKNKTNQSEVPLGLKYVWIDRSIAEFLIFKLKIGTLQIDTLKFDRIAKEISEGDTKVVYNETETTGGKFESYLTNLRTTGEDEIIKFRRFVW